MAILGYPVAWKLSEEMPPTEGITPMLHDHETLADEIARIVEKGPHGYKVSLTSLDFLLGYFMADADYKAFQKRMWIAVDGPEEWARQMGEEA